MDLDLNLDLNGEDYVDRRQGQGRGRRWCRSSVMLVSGRRNRQDLLTSMSCRGEDGEIRAQISLPCLRMLAMVEDLRRLVATGEGDAPTAVAEQKTFDDLTGA